MGPNRAASRYARMALVLAKKLIYRDSVTSHGKWKRSEKPHNL